MKLDMLEEEEEEEKPPNVICPNCGTHNVPYDYTKSFALDSVPVVTYTIRLCKNCYKSTHTEYYVSTLVQELEGEAVVEE